MEDRIMTDTKKKRITKKFKEQELDKVYSHGHEDVPSIDLGVFEKEMHSYHGEILRDSADLLIEMFSKVLNKNAVFYDLGCGQGKLIMHMALKTKMKKIVGIEMSKERYEKALEVASDIEFPFTQPSIINQDFRDTDLSDATIVYFDNVGYSIDETNEVLSLLPPNCLVVYTSHGARSGDRFFPNVTSYSVHEFEDGLFNFWSKHASYRHT